MYNKWRVGLILLVLGCRFTTYVQVDSLARKELIYNSVYKNIAAYYINYHIVHHFEIDKNKILTRGLGQYFFDESLPDSSYNLEMTITRLNWKYPLPNQQVYAVHINGLRFKSLSKRLVTARQVVDGPRDEPPSNDYLLCVGPHDVISFISGTFFVHDVTADFKLDSTDPESYLEYLKYSTYQDLTSNIAYLKRKRHQLYYNAYSNAFHKKVFLIIDDRKPHYYTITDHI